MKGIRILLMALCLLWCVLPAVHAAKMKMPPGSYLTKPVADVDELCDHIQQDPKVAARFTKHFGMNTLELVSYMKQHFWMKRLTNTARYTEYYVDTRGRMVSHVKLLRAGTVVLCNYDGRPVIDLKCGNPLTKNLPKPVAKAEPKVEVAEIQQETPKPIVVEPEPVAPEPVVVQVPEPVVPEPVTQVLGNAPQEITFSPVNVGTIAAALLPLLGAGAVNGSNDVTQPVPEPSSMIILLTGVTTLVASRRRLRR